MHQRQRYAIKVWKGWKQNYKMKVMQNRLNLLDSQSSEISDHDCDTLDLDLCIKLWSYFWDFTCLFGQCPNHISFFSSSRYFKWVFAVVLHSAILWESWSYSSVVICPVCVGVSGMSLIPRNLSMAFWPVFFFMRINVFLLENKVLHVKRKIIIVLFSTFLEDLW